MFRSFKRRASLLRDGLSRFGEDYQLHLKISLKAGEAPKTDFSESSALAVFAAQLRPFMDLASQLELSAVWAVLLEEGLLDDEAKEKCSSTFAAAERLDFGVRLNGCDLTSRDVCFAYGEGELFNNNADAQKMMKQLTHILGPQLLRFLFYGACFNLVGAVFALLDVILAAERMHPELGPLPAETEQCIYCLSTSGDFTTEEHVIPEAFGLDDMRLYGCVCNACNNKLSALDQFLADFEPLAFLRVQKVPLTKKGKFPHADFRDFTLSKTKPRELTITSKTGRSIFEHEDLPDGTFRLTNTMIGKRPIDAIRLARALFKVALGVVAFDCGAAFACGSRFDTARAFIWGHEAIPNHIVITKKADIHDEIRTEWQQFEGATLTLLDFFGFRFLLNLEPSPLFVPDGYAQLPLMALWLGELTERGIVGPCGSPCVHSPPFASKGPEESLI